MTKKGMFQVFAAVAVLALLVNTGEAAANPTGSHEIRVINDYATPVEVYLEDAQGKLHELGRVDDADFQVLALDKELAALGEFRLKIFPVARMGTMVDASAGIASVELAVDEGDAVNVWLGEELTRSQIEVTRG